MPPKRKGPALGSRPSSNTTNAAPSLTDAALLELAYARGYKLACRCLRCGHWMAAQPVPLDHLGPKYRRRLDAQRVAS
jgi:hypothetical protein